MRFFPRLLGLVASTLGFFSFAPPHFLPCSDNQRALLLAPVLDRDSEPVE
jgi:hypothetical protein